MSRFHTTLRDHFIPHEGNNHTPHVLRHRTLFGYSVALVLLKVLVLVTAVALPSAVVFSSAITTGNIMALTNAARSSMGLPELTQNVQLEAAAQAKADDMILNKYFAHTSPSGKTPWDWIHSTGYIYTLAGENLAVYYQSAEDVTSGWMASPTHRANIVNERFSEIGIGITRGVYEGFDTFMVVQMFGEPVAVGVPESPEPAEVPDAPVATETGAPVIDDDSVAIAPTSEGYEVTLAVERAEDVLVYVEDTVTPLELESPQEQRDETTVWSGTIPLDEAVVDFGGAPLFVSAHAEDGAQTTQAVAWVAPHAQTGDLYAFATQPKPQVKLFGFLTLENLDDAVGRVYFLTIVGLGAALLVSLLARFEHHRHSTTAHALVVILLAGFLAVL